MGIGGKLLHAEIFPMHILIFLCFLVLSASVVRAIPAKDLPAYKNASLPVDDRVKDLLGRMTLDEKIRQTHMFRGNILSGDKRDAASGAPISPERVRALLGTAGIGAHSYRPYSAAYVNEVQKIAMEETRLGIPVLIFAEGLHGYQGTSFPQMIALAATWDIPLVSKIYEHVGTEARSFGVHAIHGPVLDLARDARWGRCEETFGEDTFLSSRMAVATVKGLQKDDLKRPDAVIADIKHFGGHSPAQAGINMGPVHVGQRELLSDYLAVFRAAFQEGGARMTMAAYHEIDGIPCIANSWLLTDLLRKEWGFNGAVISDAGAVARLTNDESVSHGVAGSPEDAAAQALNAGMSISYMEFGFDERGEDRWPAIVKRAHDQGKLSEETINRAAGDVLRLKFELGLFDNPYTDDSLADKVCGNAEGTALALQAAREAMTLVQNRGALLPLSKNLKKIAVIGPQSTSQTGDYAPWKYGKTVGILDAIRAAVSKETAVTYVRGVPIKNEGPQNVIAEEYLWQPDGTGKGLCAEYFANKDLSGEPALRRVDPAVNFDWNDLSPDARIPFDNFSVRWTGKIKVPRDMEIAVGTQTTDGSRLWIDGKLVGDGWRGGSVTPSGKFAFKAGQFHDVKMEYFQGVNPKAIARLKWEFDKSGGIPEALAAARDADVVVVLVGENGATCGENEDRSTIDLPGRQDELVKAVQATGKPCVLVVLSGRALALPWEAVNIPAILMGWFPGQLGGQAVADVLFGDYNPAGRLPVSMPKSLGQLPIYYSQKRTAAFPNARTYHGDENPAMNRAPLFPFGHGLSYTKFDYSNLTVTPKEIPPDGRAKVAFVVKNSGRRDGDEVVQLYVQDVVSSVTTPFKLLKGFKRIHIKAGESQTVAFDLGPEDLRLLDREWKWVVEPGEFKIMVGASSEDIRLNDSLVVQ